MGFELSVRSGGSPDRTRLRPQSLQNGNILGEGQRLSAISTSSSAKRASRDVIDCPKSLDFPAYSCVSWEAWPNARMGGWRGRIRTAIWRVGNQTLSPVRKRVVKPLSARLFQGITLPRHHHLCSLRFECARPALSKIFSGRISLGCGQFVGPRGRGARKASSSIFEIVVIVLIGSRRHPGHAPRLIARFARRRALGRIAAELGP
jgi:hypothetical protein